MLRFLFLSLIVFQLSSCAQLQQVVEQLPQGQQAPTINIAAGLREALTLGIDKQVTKLTQKDGFFKNERVKIVLPEALTKVDKALRTIGLSDLADEGIETRPFFWPLHLQNVLNKEFRQENCKDNVLTFKNKKVKSENASHIFPELEFLNDFLTP